MFMQTTFNVFSLIYISHINILMLFCFFIKPFFLSLKLIFSGWGFWRPQHQPVADEDHETWRWVRFKSITIIIIIIIITFNAIITINIIIIIVTIKHHHRDHHQARLPRQGQRDILQPWRKGVGLAEEGDLDNQSFQVLIIKIILY